MDIPERIEKAKELQKQYEQEKEVLREQEEVTNSIRKKMNQISSAQFLLGEEIKKEVCTYPIGFAIRNVDGEHQILQAIELNWKFTNEDEPYHIELKFTKDRFTIEGLEKVLQEGTYQEVKDKRKELLPTKAKIISINRHHTYTKETPSYLVELLGKRYIKCQCWNNSIVEAFNKKLSDSHLTKASGYFGRHNAYTLRIPYQERKMYRTKNNKKKYYYYNHYSINILKFYTNKEEFVEGEI